MTCSSQTPQTRFKDIEIVSFDAGFTLLEPAPSFGVILAEQAQYLGYNYDAKILNDRLSRHIISMFQCVTSNGKGMYACQNNQSTIGTDHHRSIWLIYKPLDYFGDTYENPSYLRRKSKYFKYLKNNGMLELEDSWLNKYGTYSEHPIALDSMPSKLPYEHTQEMWCAREAMKFMEESIAINKPFNIKVSFQRPHHPLLPNKKFWNMYPNDLELPESFYREPSQRPPHFQKMYNIMHELKWDYNKDGESYEDGARRAWRRTLACISQIDDVFGKILIFLEEKGLDRNTIVIYGTDHGCYHGIHGIVEKAPGICSDSVTRVPMIWRVPGVIEAGSVCHQFVENIDIAPTITSLCGVPPMESTDGKDLTKLLEGNDYPIRETAVTENPWSKVIYWKNWRFVHCQPEHFEGQDVSELYDIENDPDEKHNLYYSSELEQIVNKCRKYLIEWLIITTRIVTNHPAQRNDEQFETNWRYIYPLASDGKAPNSIQPINRDNNEISSNICRFPAIKPWFEFSCLFGVT